MARSSVGNFYAAHPGLDWILGLLGGGLAFVAAPAALVEAVAAVGSDASLGASALFGILFAAATFTCTMAYTSTSTTMLVVRTFRAREQARTWVSILAALLATAVLSLVLVAAWGHTDRFAFAGLAASMTLGILVTVRVLWWFRLTIGGDVADQEARLSGVTKMPRKADHPHH